LRNRRINLDVDQSSRDWLAAQGYSEVYGARAIARVVRTEVLFPMAQKLLKGTIRYVFVYHGICGTTYLTGIILCTIRDGDTVSIRVGVEGKSLNIQDNHVPDPSISARTEGAEP
jgi:ATP-dependent Clp protease ATP-binding subunit ClpB